jgi:Flp pilus assembly protein TadD
MLLGWISFIERDFERGLTNLSHAHELNPNCTMTLMQLGVLLTSLGRAKAGDTHLRQAIRLSPRDLWLGFMFAALGFTCYALESYEEGIDFLRRAIEREPQAPANHVILAASLVEIGDLDGAGAAIRAQRHISENYFLEYLDGKRLPYQDPKTAERYAAALRRAAQAADRSPVN